MVAAANRNPASGESDAAAAQTGPTLGPPRSRQVPRHGRRAGVGGVSPRASPERVGTAPCGALTTDQSPRASRANQRKLARTGCSRERRPACRSATPRVIARALPPTSRSPRPGGSGFPSRPTARGSDRPDPRHRQAPGRLPGTVAGPRRAVGGVRAEGRTRPPAERAATHRMPANRSPLRSRRAAGRPPTPTPNPGEQ
jgi:hypothetical protein